MPDIIAKMQEFNKLLDRSNKAEAFFNDKSISVKRKNEVIDEYAKVVKKLESLHNEIKELGYTFNVNDYKYGIGRW